MTTTTATAITIDTTTPTTPRRRNRRKPLTAEQQGLAERYMPMARALAKSYKRTWPQEWEEFESAALMALVEAAESFDPGRNVRFSTFARLRVVGALRDVQRRMGSTKWRVDDSHAVHEAADLASLEPIGEVINTTPDPEVGRDLESLDAVEAWLRRLPPRHAAACRAIYLHGCNQAEAAARLGCSQSRLSYLHREALAMLNGTWYRRVAEGAPEGVAEVEAA
jgi:RNA polymerase sigma factor (sigma-70 family)